MVYLCGPINGCDDDECMTWRQKAIRLIPNAVNPLDRDYRGAELNSYREIVEIDKRAIRNSDALLVRLTRPSIGSAMEIHYAWSLGLPVVLWADRNDSISPWLRYHCTSIVYSLEEAVGKLRRFL